MTNPRILIIGGGLAGMAAAVALESTGAAVTLLEARRELGGRAGSFEEPQTGEQLDNCQHVLLGCCTNLIDFYRRMGVDQLIRYERTVHFLDPHGGRHDLWAIRGLPAPLHLGLSLSLFGALTLHERFAVARAMTAMLRLGRAGRGTLAGVPFGQWLDEHHQPPGLVTKFYDPILISALNEDSRRASATYAIQVFQEAMLANASGYVIGLPNCPLGELYRRPPCRDLRLGTRVAGIEFADGIVSGVRLQGGELLTADAYVVATNHHAVQKWIPAAVAGRDSRFADLDKLESVPILGAHLWFDRPVMRESHAALIAGPLQWLFRKDAAGQVLHGVISAARDWVNRPKEECLQLFAEQVRSLFPAARDAKLVRGVMVIEKRATFSPLPGSDRFRPTQPPPLGGVRNLFLAGDYTKTDWPATMEGAVRSGYLAAEAVAPGREYIVDDLPIQWPAKMLGLARV